jgi:uncharacterized protein (TIGR03067 family)
VTTPHSSDSLQGRWTPTTAVLGGNPFPDQIRASISLVIDGDRYTTTVGPATDLGALVLDPSASPASMDVRGTEGPNAGRTIPAIYECSDDTLRICYDLSGVQRPTTFESPAGTMHFLVTYTRAAG